MGDTANQVDKAGDHVAQAASVPGGAAAAAFNAVVLSLAAPPLPICVQHQENGICVFYLLSIPRLYAAPMSRRAASCVPWPLHAVVVELAAGVELGGCSTCCFAF